MERRGVGWVDGRTELGEVLGCDGVLVVLVVIADGEERRVELLELHHVLVPHAVQRRPLGAAAALLLARCGLPVPSAHPRAPSFPRSSLAALSLSLSLAEFESSVRREQGGGGVWLTFPSLVRSVSQPKTLLLVLFGCLAVPGSSQWVPHAGTLERWSAKSQRRCCVACTCNQIMPSFFILLFSFF